MPGWATTPSDAQHPFGSGLFWAPFGTTVVAPAPAIPNILGQPWTEIGKMVRVTSPERAAGDTKITHLKSPNKAHEYIPGYVDGGTLTFRLHHSPASHLVVNSLRPNDQVGEQRIAWAVQFSNGVVCYFNGFLKSSPVEVTEGDDPVAIDVTVRCSGDLFIVFPA